MHVPAPALSVLVGRDRELAFLRERITAACIGQGGMVLIGGEAGIGKTALAETVCREAAERGALVLVGRCYDLAETPAYGPWLHLFARVPAGAAMPTPPAAFAAPGVVGAVASQAALFRDVLRYLRELAVARPLVVLLDDLHWADAASLDLLRFVAREVADVPLLLVATYRADEVSRDHPLYQLLPALVRESGAERLDLRPLDADAVRILVAARYRLADADVARLVGYLQVRAEGNALFVGELLRALEEGDVLGRDGDTWTLGDLTHTSVPMLLRQVIDARVSHLGAEAQRLLAVTAVIGQEIPLAVLETVAGSDEAAVLDMVEQGMDARLLTEAPDGERIHFAHALIREALYEGLSGIQRRRIHRRVAETLAARQPPDPDAIANHFQRAGDARAAPWLVQAGDHAERAYAWTTAVTRFEGALAILVDDDAEAATRGWVLLRLALIHRFANPARALELLAEAETCLAAARDPLLAACVQFCGGNIRCLNRELARGLEEMEQGTAALAALAPAEQLRLRAIPPTARRMTGNDGEGLRGMWLALSGRYAAARTLCERVIASSPDGDRSDGTSRAYAALGLAATYAAYGLPDDARRAYGEAIGGFAASAHYVLLTNAYFGLMRDVQLRYDAEDLAGRERLLAEADTAMARLGDADIGREFTRVMRHPVWLLEGRWDALEAAIAAKKADERPELTSQRQAIGPVEGILVAAWRGDTARAWAAIRAHLPHIRATVPGDENYTFATVVQRAAAALALDRADTATAREWLEAHDRWLAWSDARLVEGRAEGEILWARYDRQGGDTQRAQEHGERALATATTPRQPLALLAAHRLLGELATDAGRYDEADRNLRRSLALADACRAPYERALTLLALAALHTAQGTADAALRSLQEVRDICVPLAAAPALARVDALVARLAATGSARPRHPAGLSAREVEVLQLLAAGRTNPQIAAALFLSPATVRHHVEHILTKTDSENRAAAAAFAQRHGLA